MRSHLSFVGPPRRLAQVVLPVPEEPDPELLPEPEPEPLLEPESLLEAEAVELEPEPLAEVEPLEPLALLDALLAAGEAVVPAAPPPAPAPAPLPSCGSNWLLGVEPQPPSESAPTTASAATNRFMF